MRFQFTTTTEMGQAMPGFEDTRLIPHSMMSLEVEG